MAKITGPHQSPRAPALRGALVIQPTRAGVVAKAWPKKRPGKMSPKQQEAIEKFREAAIICKYAPTEDQVTSRKLAEGSQFLPRDLQYMAIYGRLATLFFSNGQRRYQMASKIDLTDILDILGFAPGTVLTRGADYWEGLPPGPSGWVLTTGEDGQPARWAPGGAGGITGWFDGAVFFAYGASDTTHNYTKGSLYVPTQDIILTGLRSVIALATANTDLAIEVWRMSSPDENALPVERVASTSPKRKGSSNPYMLAADVNEEEPRLLAGFPYLFATTFPENPNFLHNLYYYTENNPNHQPNAPLIPLLHAFTFDTSTISPGLAPATYRPVIFPHWCSGYMAPPDP